jgi:hypothetical protein
MNTFPLFDSLYKETTDKKLSTVELSSAQKTTFLKKIDKIDKNGMELIYALICAYQLIESEGSNYIIPYNGKQAQNEITFDIDEFPPHLKQILHKFISMHIKSMEEEKKLNNKRLTEKTKINK